jgi:hypothetical protein
MTYKEKRKAALELVFFAFGMPIFVCAWAIACGWLANAIAGQ